MSTDTTPLTPALIWREMTTEQRLAAAEALWGDQDSGPQQAEAVQAIARQFRFRPQSVLRLGAERRVRQLAAVHAVSASLASRALVVYHLSSRRPMLETFLDHLGITHEGGMIAEGPTRAPDEGRLRAATSLLLNRFPAADIRVYLRTLAVQDPDTWGALIPIVDELLPSSRPA